MCAKSGYLHLMVPKSRFRLLCGEDVLTTYEFNTKTAKLDGRNWEQSYPRGRGEYDSV